MMSMLSTDHLSIALTTIDSNMVVCVGILSLACEEPTSTSYHQLLSTIHTYVELEIKSALAAYWLHVVP